MGCLDAGCSVLCVVAGLDDGCCIGWKFVFRLASIFKGAVILHIAWYGEVLTSM